MGENKQDFTRELYQDAVANNRFLKRQQWTVTNYGLLVFVAVVAFNEYVTGAAHCALAAVALLTAIVGIYGLIRFHRDMMGNRRRLAKIRETFDAQSLEAWRAFDKP